MDFPKKNYLKNHLSLRNLWNINKESKWTEKINQLWN
jgi:hypothetical protein